MDKQPSMEIEVDEAVMCATTHCTRSFRCLEPSGSSLCRVQKCVRGTVHFIECLDRTSCSYRMSFGKAFVCNCPVRKEIYDRYGL